MPNNNMYCNKFAKAELQVVVSKPIFSTTEKHTESHMEVGPPPKNQKTAFGLCYPRVWIWIFATELDRSTFHIASPWAQFWVTWHCCKVGRETWKTIQSIFFNFKVCLHKNCEYIQGVECEWLTNLERILLAYSCVAMSAWSEVKFIEFCYLQCKYESRMRLLDRFLHWPLN